MAVSSQVANLAVAKTRRLRAVMRGRLISMLTYLSVAVVVAIFAIPFLWMLVTSLKTPDALSAPGVNWIPNPVDFQNYVKAVTAVPFIQYFVNTMVICLPNVVGTVFSCSLAAYGLACLRWPGRGASFAVVLATMMLPYPVTIIPLYLMFRTLGWLHIASGYLPLTIPAFFGAPFFIFLLRQFFMSIPAELFEAARVDGASEFRIYAQIVLPLAKPALATTALFTFLYTYTDFLNPLIYISDPSRYTLSLGLLSFFGSHGASWGPLMAASVMFTFPTIFLFLLTQRTFIEGIVTTGLKG